MGVASFENCVRHTNPRSATSPVGTAVQFLVYSSLFFPGITLPPGGESSLSLCSRLFAASGRRINDQFLVYSTPSVTLPFEIWVFSSTVLVVSSLGESLRNRLMKYRRQEVDM